MHSRVCAILTAFMIALACGVAAPPASAAVITLENDVDISWSQVGSGPCGGRPVCPEHVLVFGLPRLVPNASAVGSELIFDVDLFSQVFNQFRLLLHVADANLEVVTVNGNPLVLEYSSAQFQFPFDDFFTVQNGIVRLTDFENFASLPQGVDLVFVLDGGFEVSGQRVAECQTCNPGASITVSGPGREIAAVVPEPSTLLLMLSSLGTLLIRPRSIGS
jgi:hypothetical protein